MTKSTITRERIQRIMRAINSEAYDEEEIREWLSSDEIMELSRMALAAMDSSESVELPLDYLQGHKDGLDWAAQLAESNHPQTGDWLYDDPIELAKAIRKGPDMPPAQPVADSEPDRNPVLAYADSYRDMAKQGIESVPIWSVITDLERNIAPLYRHTQPVPVVNYVPLGDSPYDVPYSMPSNLREFIDQEIGILFSDDDAKGVWIACRRAAMLQAAPVCTCPSGDGSLRWPCPVHPGNSPAIPDSARDALEKALAAMEFMGDTLNNLDAVCTEDVELVAPAFDAVRSVLAAAPQEVKGE
ncbi:DUF551 domain-containing protein [Klebsiella pneumoniae]|uniref:DUF551 domain-containing protein n=1 Tax=Klebsiella pneumoniae TaxID=573 RepID=UPI001E2F213B|nr:DUF551 domain-containing protein [Klebsiella pneumoniae]